MSTRGCYRFSDGSNRGPFTVYKHSDNYPDGESGGIAAIAKALEYAWALPRFEADEFAAGFVAANKMSPMAFARYYEKMAAECKDPETQKYLLENAAKFRDPKSDYAKGCGGDVRLLNTPDATTLEHMPGDIQYLYDVTCRKGKLWIVVAAIGGRFDNELTATPIAEGTLQQMLLHFAEKKKTD